MSGPSRDIRGRLARKSRQLTSPSAWQASAAKRVWKAGGPCSPTAPAPLLPDALASVRWPTQYEWPHAARWVMPLREGLSRLADVQPRAIEQPYEGIVLLEVA